MSVLVEDPGLWTTVQDCGRTGYRAVGVPLGGAFDLRAAGLANALVGNTPEDDAATLELTLRGGAYRAETSLAVALAGAAMPARVAGRRGTRDVPIPGSLTLEPGDRLHLGGARRGARTYLAVAGGWRTPPVLGSRSDERRVGAGDRLAAGPARIPWRRPAAPWTGPPDEDPMVVRVVAGPDLPPGDALLETLEGLEYRVDPRSNRMGVRLEGPDLGFRADPDRLSAPVAPGAVQVAGGRPLILGVACGTMGGYPHVAHVVSADLPRLGQARPGGAIRFRAITLTDARRIDREQRRGLVAQCRALAILCRDGLRHESAD